MIPQLRVRTEYNFRKTYGPIPRVAERLAALKTPAAGIVDSTGSWGHVGWERELNSVGVTPLFGAEFKLPEVGRYWVLATDAAAFYRFSSFPPKSPQELAEAVGVVRFAGDSLTDPALFDFVDLNPSSLLHNRRAIQLSHDTGKPLVITSDPDYPGPDDRSRYLAWADNQRMTPQYIVGEKELRDLSFCWMDEAEWKRALKNTRSVAERCAGLKLPRAPIISVTGNLRKLVLAGKRYRLSHGHISDWTTTYQSRMERELKLISEKEFDSYFIVVSDLIRWAKDHMLVGPGRGSSAGSLVCYLLRITEVDPIVHNLIFERFIDVNRVDLPDIDIDFNDQKREQAFQYLAEKYGAENTARIGSVNRLKPRSVMAHVGKRLGIPKGATFNVANVLIEHSSGDARYGNSLEDTLTGTEPGRALLERYPEARLMTELEEHASHSGVHAAGVIVSNVPVIEYCTVRDGIAQIDKKDAEALNLLKIDALGLRTLGVIEDAGCVSSSELYGLKLNDQAVFDIFSEHKFSGVFQFEGAAQRKVSVQIDISKFQHLDHITALSRPGPLGGGAANTYINRFHGREPVKFAHPSMEEYLGDTYGVVLYQEQVMRIVREVGNFSWEDTSTIRKAMSGRKGTEYFDRMGKQFVTGSRKHGLDKLTAEQIWSEIVNFGAWGMNRSHTVAYSIISYWCAYMKRYHPLEYAAALMRNAKDDEQTIETLRELNSEGIGYVPFDADKSEANWVARDGAVIGGYTNLIGIGPAKAAHYIQKRSTTGLTAADKAKLAKHKIKFMELNPAHSMWRDIYEHPASYNINGPVKRFGELEDRENAVVIARLLRSDRRDENESVRANRRGYMKTGQTLFLDMFMVDDSVSKPVLVRIRPRMWFTHGVKVADRAYNGQDWFLIRGQWLAQFSMMTVNKIKCLTNEEIFV